ncbi:MAG TPA: bifunctional folylpolyglutamate synthase/dihydrofolate synthase [Mariprofundaceae bacterium]|nr:bifunctional folylpolyglutamate synthase/dihydrofolate synthase [Mariprofundaceae bacterium]
MSDKPADIAAWLEQLGQRTADRDYRPGHARMQALLATLPAFRPRLRVRVAGTNGKGSTSHMLAAALKAAGLKVGLYTSPHLLAFNERIRINSVPVPDAQILASIEKLMPAALATGASYFEMATAAALDIFSKAQVDAEILEAGVGARLDATTAVPADMALITPIGLDHQAWLGDSLAQIAGEKAHVMNGCRWSLSAPQPPEVAEVLQHANPALRFITPSHWDDLAMAGAHQQLNASLAKAAAETLLNEGTITGNRETLHRAIADTRVAGRLQHLRYREADLWLDAAHNRHAVEALLPTLKGLNLDTVMVFTREDRDLRECIPLFRQCAKRVVGADESVFDAGYPTVTEALTSELGGNPSGNYLILGSFLTVAEALQLIHFREA